MSAVIIGIHGLRNKPPQSVLADWWQRSIVEGFRVLELPQPKFRFELAYWAQYLHQQPQDPAVKNPRDPAFLWKPYEPGMVFGPRNPRAFKKDISATIHKQLLQLIALKSGFLNVELVRDIILHRMFEELDIYYHHDLRDNEGKTRPAKELIRGELVRLLNRHRGDSILLLAHSMGAIIAYDVLLHEAAAVPVHTLITCGAPLGFPVIMKKIRHELGMSPDNDALLLPTPESLQHRWLNCSDPEDVSCLNFNLRNHYQPNSHGVRPFDEIVDNTYEYQGYKNPHKVYGYLRTAEITRALNTFLTVENAGLWKRLGWIFSRPKL